MKSLQIEFFNGTGRLKPVKPETRYALSGIRNGVRDSIKAVSGREKDVVSFYETAEEYEIQEALERSLSGDAIDMSTFMCKLPYPPVADGIVKAFFIVVPHENKSEQLPNNSAHYGNDISIITTYDLGKGSHGGEEKDKIFARGRLMGAHMTGHLMLPERMDGGGHCKDPGCCMHSHKSGLRSIDEIIEERKKGGRRGLFCERTLGQIRDYLEI